MNSSKNNLARGILFTDFYQLTMAQLYFRAGLQDEPVQFDYFFRTLPDYGEHRAGYCVQAGMATLLEWMEGAAFGEEEISALSGLTGKKGRPLFEPNFLDWLREEGNFREISISAIPEGRAVFPDLPLATVRGPLAAAQLLESPLLNLLNFQTLIATKAARIRRAAGERLLIDFGMRRAQGFGANAAARAALVGGADFTSNTGVSLDLGYPPKGTHAHSMVQLFMAHGKGELAAFRSYAEIYPDDCLLLVDTVDTLESGVPNAIRVFEELKKKGHKPLGIRLDSGDLAQLAVESAKMLDRAGFAETAIVLSNQLDEAEIRRIDQRIAEEPPKQKVDPDRLMKRLAYGVGTRLVTSQGDAALDGVYKLTAVKEGDNWKPAFKISETPEKTINPGEKQAWRIYGPDGKASADFLSRSDEDPRQEESLTLRHPSDPGKERTLLREEISRIEPLLETIREGGRPAGKLPSLENIRKTVKADLERLPDGVKKIFDPDPYPVFLTEDLWKLKQKLISSYRHPG